MGENEGNQSDMDNPKEGAESSIAVAAKGYIEVILEPSGERHMPTPPEILWIGGFVGRVEVLRQEKSHEHGYANGDIGVAGEVGIDLQRVEEKGREVFESGEEKRVLENTVDEINCQIVREYDFLYKSIEYPKDGYTELTARQAERAIELRDKFRRPDYRSCHKLREERDIEPEIEQVGDRAYFAIIDVGGIGDYLKNIERDADGQYDTINSKTTIGGKTVACPSEDVEDLQVRAKQVVEHIGEKVGILEVTKQPEVEHYTDNKPETGTPRTGAMLLGAINEPGEKIVGASDEEKNQYRQATAFVVEKEADEQKERIAQQAFGMQKTEDGIDNGKERPEIELREEQRTIGVESEDMSKEVGHWSFVGF